MLQARELVLEVDHVVGLLIPQSCVLVLGQSIDEVILLRLPGVSFRILISVLLCDGVVLGLDFLVFLLLEVNWGFSLALELLSGLGVLVHVLFPVVVVVIAREEYFIAGSLCRF